MPPNVHSLLSDGQRTDEKVIVFEYVLLLLRLRRCCRTSVLRAVVSLCEVHHAEYQTIVVRILCEAAIRCENVLQVLHLAGLLMADLAEEGTFAVAHLLSYSLETELPFVHNVHALWPLLEPLSEFSTPHHANLERYVGSMVSFLQKCPGVSCFGIQCGAFSHMMARLSHRPGAIVSVLKSILKSDQHFSTISDSFSGLMLTILLRGGLIERLSQLGGTECAATDFLNELLPWTSRVGSSSAVQTLPSIISNTRSADRWHSTDSFDFLFL
jgi:hypothetical protein